MNVFEAVKQSVTTRQAAEHYGIHVGRNGMACCPFHNDKTPSMKLDQRYHCFGCGADGDVIDFTAALYGLGKKEAAVQLAQDFGLSYEDWKPPGKAKNPKPRQKSPEEQFQ
ncbi:DNA primase, partial [Firmicutes bacterium AF36-19BH]